MVESDKAKFIELLAQISAVFGREITPLAATGYWRALEDAGMEHVEDAILLALRECERMPTPAELYQRAHRPPPLRQF